MITSPHWRHPTADTAKRDSVRQILREVRPESRRLVREVYREKLENGVRGKIARLRHDKTPWNVAVKESL